MFVYDLMNDMLELLYGCSKHSGNCENCL